MFPPSLHKNIRELDKQITRLESECENMEAEELRRGVNAKFRDFPKSKEPVNSLKKGIVREQVDRAFVTGPRISAAKRNKPSSVTRMCHKRSANSSKKIPAVRQASTTTTSTSEEPKRGKKYVHVCPICGRAPRHSDQGNKDKKIQGITKCICSKELSNECNQNLDLCDSDKQYESDNEKQVLHKGILRANPGGTIEVTVTQKSSKTPRSINQGKSLSTGKIKGKNKSDLCITKENSARRLRSPENDKWCEIFQLESASIAEMGMKSYRMRNNGVKSNYYLNSEFDNHLETEPEAYSSVNDNQQNIQNVIAVREVGSERYNNENNCPNTIMSSVGDQSRQKLSTTRKNVENVIDASPTTEKSIEEKNMQCATEGIDKSDELLDPTTTLFALMNALKGKLSEEEKKNILNDLEASLDKLEEDKINGDCAPFSYDSNYVRRLQKHFLNKKKLCEKLMKENAKLSEDLAVRDQLLSNLNSKEKEYLSLITSLKASLEQTKAHAEDNIEILKELNMTKNKLLKETKIADALRKNHAKMQEEVKKCMLENDKLKTEIRLIKLESQKFCVLLAGKDAEIKRYKDEVESFQRQITDQLTALRSNSASKEVQKAMEAIIQQSQGFGMTDLDSAFSEDHTDRKLTLSKSNKVMHSSPTSTKSSASNCSWNQISSIHEDELKADVIRTLDEVLIGSGEKKDNCDGEEMPSFVSCESANDTTAIDRSLNDEKLGLAKQNLRRNIEELLEDIKTKYSKRLLSIPSECAIFDELLSSVGTSDLSDVSSGFLDKS